MLYGMFQKQNPTLTPWQTGWGWKGLLEGIWSNAPAQTLMQVQSAKEKELFGRGRENSIWLMMELLETSNKEIKIWKMVF